MALRECTGIIRVFRNPLQATSLPACDGECGFFSRLDLQGLLEDTAAVAGQVELRERQIALKDRRFTSIRLPERSIVHVPQA